MILRTASRVRVEFSRCQSGSSRAKKGKLEWTSKDSQTGRRGQLHRCPHRRSEDLTFKKKSSGKTVKLLIDN
jgi:hypothetical protein